LKQRDIRRPEAAEIKFMSCTAGYSSLDHRRNEDTLEIKVDTVEEKFSQYKHKWLNHVGKMEDIRYPKQLLDYRHIRRSESENGSFIGVTSWLRKKGFTVSNRPNFICNR
jgi:hypothetical protein